MVAEVLIASLAKLGHYRLCWGTRVRQDEEMGWASYALLRIDGRQELLPFLADFTGALEGSSLGHQQNSM